MTDDRAILICSGCTQPYRLVSVSSGGGPALLNCPYCGSASISEATGVMRAEAIPEGERIFFWDARRRRDALTGRAEPE